MAEVRSPLKNKGLDRTYDIHQKTSSHFGMNDIVHAFANPKQAPRSFGRALLAMAVSRCYKLVIALTAFAAMVSVLNSRGRQLSFQPTLLTVLGTVLGFVISYRTLSSFERYNEGRRYWSQIIQASRTLGVSIWFLPNVQEPGKDDEGRSPEEMTARILVEKKTMINLVEAFSVAVKHNLRGEEGAAYEDLYHLIKFLPPYAIQGEDPSPTGDDSTVPADVANCEPLILRRASKTYGTELERPTLCESPKSSDGYPLANLPSPVTMNHAFRNSIRWKSTTITAHTVIHGEKGGDVVDTLRPANTPPRRSILDALPFWQFYNDVRARAREIAKNKTRVKEATESVVVSKNIPLVILWYMTSYVSALSARKWIDVPKNNQLTGALNQLTDALTGLERIRTTPLPFSYSTHLWIITIVYSLALPFQLWTTLKWVAVPATAVTSFVLIGFLEAGDEIENPFGYDKNDLNLSFFTRDIIRNELLALTARPPPDPAEWMFVDDNDHIFTSHWSGCEGYEHRSPRQWVAGGSDAIWESLKWY